MTPSGIDFVVSVLSSFFYSTIDGFSPTEVLTCCCADQTRKLSFLQRQLRMKATAQAKKQAGLVPAQHAHTEEIGVLLY